ncbi:hypothetical protein GCM10025331_72780 [Actinoplanes utahensis]|nr:hypothetical protein Aut01nite_68130 [Actinoplanes utahensis]
MFSRPPEFSRSSPARNSPSTVSPFSSSAVPSRNARRTRRFAPTRIAIRGSNHPGARVRFRQIKTMEWYGPRTAAVTIPGEVAAGYGPCRPLRA